MIYELAGVVGVDPHGLTLYELCIMARAKLRDEWTRTAAQMALTANCWRDPHKVRAFSPTDFLPRDLFDEPRAIPADITALKILLNKKGGAHDDDLGNNQ